MNKINRTVSRPSILTLISIGILGFSSLLLNAQSGGNQLLLKDGYNGYNGNEDFYTYFIEGGVFNSKTDLDNQTLKVSPLQADTKTVMRFKGIPFSQSSYGMVYRVALVLTLKAQASPDTIMVHNLNDRDSWHERSGNYNSLNGQTPWSGVNGQLIQAWARTDGVGKVNGNEAENTKVTIEFYPTDAASRKALLDSWTDGSNQGFVIRGVSGDNQFYSSDAYNMAHRPELIIEYSTY